MRRLALHLAVAVLTVTAHASAALPTFQVGDLGEAGVLPRLFRGPDDRLHLLYVTSQGFRWRVWDEAGWNDAGLVPSTQGQGKSKFNNPSIVALPDGSFHVLWGPVASFGASHDVYLQSHDGSKWGARQTIRDDYTEYLQLAPLAGSQLMVIAGVVCPTGCTSAFPMAFSTGAPGQAFSSFTEIPTGAPEAKTPFVFAEPGGNVLHVVSRFARVSYLTWNGTAFSAPELLFSKSPYSVALPTVSADAVGNPVVAGVEWTGSGTTWSIDHVRLARRDGSGWQPNAEGQSIDTVEVDRSAVSADAQGGTHLFFVKHNGELSYRRSTSFGEDGPEVILTGVSFDGPETDNIAATYTPHHVHAIVSAGGTLKHILIDTDPPVVLDAGVDAPDSSAGGSAGGGGAAGGPLVSPAGGTTPASDGGCGCRATPSSTSSPWGALAIVLLARIRRRSVPSRRKTP
jgi:MYXO-CTERM domain-containing protein